MMGGSGRFRILRVAGGVHVALVPQADAADDAETTPTAEEFAATRSMAPSRAAEHLAGRAALRRLLRFVASDDAAKAPIATTRRGQPYLPGFAHLSISVSHTAGWVAVAVGERRAVGVDAQAPEPVSDEMVRRCCTAQTAHMLGTLPPRRRALEFAWIWSAQEACVKAAGLGIAGLPWTIPVPARSGAGTWRGYRWAALRSRCPVPVSCAYGELDGRPDAAVTESGGGDAS